MIKWKIDFPNEGAVLSYVAYTPGHKLTTYYDPYCQCHRYMHEKLSRNGGRTYRRLVRDTANRPAEGWQTSDEAKKAAEDYFTEYMFCAPEREAWKA